MLLNGSVNCKFLTFLHSCTHRHLFNRPNGVTFVASAGTSEFSKNWKPEQGDIVSFKHRGYLLDAAKPKHPVLYRLRPDVTWEEVVKDWDDSSSPSKATSKPPPLVSHQYLTSFNISKIKTKGRTGKKDFGRTSKTGGNSSKTLQRNWDSIP